MRVRIVISPKGLVGGTEQDLLRVGGTYDLPLPVAGLLLLEGWAAPERRKKDRHPTFSHFPTQLLSRLGLA
jgi:hypothetical protein